MRMTLEEFGRRPKAALPFGRFADFPDLSRSDHRGLVPEAVANVGKNGCNLVIAQLLESRHGDLAGVLFAFDLNRPH